MNILESDLNDGCLNRISYGLYVVTCKDSNNKDNGLIVNTVCQIASNPKKISVAISKLNYSHDVIKSSKEMNVNLLTVNAPFDDVFSRFGFHSGRDTDKFVGVELLRSPNGLGVLPNYINAYLSLKVTNYVDLGSHGLFICDVIDGKLISKEESVTYNYYQANIKPKPVAVKKGYVCKVCGHIYEGENIPVDYICPICKHDVSVFEKVELKDNNNNISNNSNNVRSVKTMKFRCKVCGQIVDVEPGSNCPVCKASPEKLVPYEEAKDDKLTWAVEHELGVAQGVDEFVLEGCRDHFKGECTEVGMYLCMARVALREGYPEVAMLFEQIAKEEAEHAARFQDLLGELVSNSTEENIKKMLAGENGACASKLAIAKKAKELNYDAIHDTVHEMARDEARHGKALEAMLNRYFKK